MNKIEAVIFDWAGTTVDYGCMAPVIAFVMAFQKFGIEPTMEEVRKPMGMPKRDHIRTMMQMERIRNLWKEKYERDFTEQDVEQVYRISENRLLEILKDFVDIKPDVLNSIRDLRKAGIKIGSTTGYTSEMMDIVTAKAAAEGYCPDCMICPDKVNHIGRPYPYMMFANMERLHVSSVKNVIKVGDTVSDIIEGKSAGTMAIGVIEGSSVMGYSKEEYSKLLEEQKEKEKARTKKVFEEAGADYVINSMKELYPLICRLEEGK